MEITDSFSQQLEELLRTKNPTGHYKVTKNNDKYIICSESNCDIFKGLNYGYDYCYKCTLHYGRNISNECEELCNSFGYTIQWKNCVEAVLNKISEDGL